MSLADEHLEPEKDSMQLPITDGGNVPVYDCHIILSTAEDGLITARVTSLAGISVTGTVERDVLRQTADHFKAKIIDFRNRGEEIPWNQQPDKPGEGEVQRWIPVHL